jgi:hypothetical protein
MDLCDIEPGQAMAVDWTETDYFTDRSALTRSALQMLRVDGPDYDPTAFAEWLAGGYSVDSTKETTRGTNSHVGVFQPQEWLRRAGFPVVPRPPGARKTGADDAKALWRGWQMTVAMRESMALTIPDRIDVTPTQFDEVRAISWSAWSHPEASILLAAPGDIEQTILWREPVTGVLVKVRLDKFSMLSRASVYGTDIAAGPAISDLKTARDHRPKPFWRSGEGYGYLEQAALYSDAVEAWVGTRPAFYFIVVRSENPRTAVYRPTEQQLQRGRDRYFAQLYEFIERQQTGDWRASNECGVQPYWEPSW